MSDAEFKTPLKIRLANRAWRKNHRDLMAGYSRKYGQANPEVRMLTSAKQRSKKRGMDCTITPIDIVIPDICPILGIPLKSGIGVSGKPGGNEDSPSLDRIDSRKGYVTGNVQVISNLANSMKSSASPEQLIKFAAWVMETYRES